MSYLCAQCQQPLRLADEGFVCDGCGARYEKQAICPDCRQPLQVLKACGAVDYFCPHGHGLISRKRIIFRPQSG